MKYIPFLLLFLTSPLFAAESDSPAFGTVNNEFRRMDANKQDKNSADRPWENIYVDSITVTNPGSLIGYKVGTFTSSASPGNQSITGVGFKPRLIVLGYCQGSANNFFSSIGWGTSSNSALALAITSVAGDSGGITTNGSMIIAISDKDGATLAQATLVSMDSGGFTLNWSVAAAVTMTYLAFQ